MISKRKETVWDLKLINVIRESSALEPVVRSFIDASNTQYYRDALNILFLNGSVFEVFENSGICCLISLSGSDKNIDKYIDLIEGKSKTNFAPFIRKIFKALLFPFIVAVKQTGVTSQEGLDEIQIQTKIITAFMTTMPELEKQLKGLTGVFINGAFLFSDLVIGGIYKGFIEIRQSHLRAGIDNDHYEEMVSQLAKLDVVEPKIRVSLCPNCMNNELVISKHSMTNDICPKCGRSWASCVLYLFKEQFGNIKSLNNDLPLFISSYLHYQVSLKALGEEVGIYPNAVIRLEEKEVEIDVYIPKYNIGIECKNYLTSYMPDTISRAKSIAGELRTQIKNYTEVGIEQIYIVANLPRRTFEQVKKMLLEMVSNNVQIPKISIIQGNPNNLLQALNELSSKLITEAQKKIEAVFQEELPDKSEQTKS